VSSINASQSDGLKRLIDALFEESRTKAESAIYDAESRSRSILSESEKYSLKKAEETLSSYASMATIESRKEVSKAEIEARMSMLRMKSDYVERVFDAAKVHLLEYTGSKEYLSRLAKSIPAASERIDAGELLLSQRDIDALGAKLKRIAGKDVAVSPANIGIGGFILVSKDGKLSIDRTLDGMLSSQKEKLRGKIADALFR
jgi:vacuolar-type H+-ATPase subunit E/Vma4